MKTRGVVLAVLVLAAAGIAASAWWLTLRPGGGNAAASAKIARYHCPMHPTMVSDRPGDCPICGMRLVPIVEEDAAPETPAPSTPSAGRKKVIYRSTMHPNEVSDQPGKDSMGMDMVAVEVEEDLSAERAPVAGLVGVRISPRKQQLIGVKTSPVVRAAFQRSIRAVGRVTLDETRLRQVHTKVAGYVERLFVNATGERVRAGQPLLEIYSPELLASQQEYLVALKARARIAAGGLPSTAGFGDELVASARRRLELFDVAEDEIRALEATGRARRTLTLPAPISGTVLRRNVTQGERIEPETTLLDIADLSRVWVIGSVYEYELPFVREGQRATMALSYVPGRSFEGRVTLVYPTLDAATRTAQVRLEFPNPSGELKPDMYAEVGLEADLGERLGVPASAVIETGARSVVFVDGGEGFFEPREITIGLRLPDTYEVLSGLREGEMVLTSGNFFVDSESKLKSALEAAAEPRPGKEP